MNLLKVGRLQKEMKTQRDRSVCFLLGLMKSGQSVIGQRLQGKSSGQVETWPSLGVPLCVPLS